MLKNITTIENANFNAQDQKITSKWYANKHLPHAPKHLKTKQYPNFLPYSKASQQKISLNCKSF